jgi:hypothetical protein
VQARPGSRLHTFIRVVNPGRRPVLVTIRGRRLILGNNGKMKLGIGPDPRWGRRVRFPSGELRIPADGYRTVPLMVRVPRHLQPDLYFIGFLVTPAATQVGSLKVINQIGSLLTIDVPGPRLRKLVGQFRMPSFVLGSHTHGTLWVKNVGHAAAQVWGETDSRASPGGTLDQQRLPPFLLPEGRSRTLTVTGKPSWPIGFVTMTAHITYPGHTDSTTKELSFSKRVLVVSIWVPIVLAGLATASTLGLVTRRRRLRSGPSASSSGEVPVASAE